jgi:hypothetical protein
MSGFGGIFAAAIIGLIFTMSFTAIIQLYINDLMDYRMEREAAIEQSAPRIESGRINSTYVFLVNITMNGAKSIRYDSLNLSDIFIVYYSDGMKITKKIEMGIGVDEWRINRVLTGNREGEIINPLNETTNTGMWDPGETLELIITTSSSIDDDLWFFSMTLIDGGTCRRTFG